MHPSWCGILYGCSRPLKRVGRPSSSVNFHDRARLSNTNTMQATNDEVAAIQRSKAESKLFLRSAAMLKDATRALVVFTYTSCRFREPGQDYRIDTLPFCPIDTILLHNYDLRVRRFICPPSLVIDVCISPGGTSSRFRVEKCLPILTWKVRGFH
jgi:hypothetical protein